jgi:hypothetical protein
MDKLFLPTMRARSLFASDRCSVHLAILSRARLWLWVGDFQTISLRTRQRKILRSAAERRAQVASLCYYYFLVILAADSSQAPAQKETTMPKKETDHERRLRLILEGKCTACGKRAPRKGRRECKQCVDYYVGWVRTHAK